LRAARTALDAASNWPPELHQLWELLLTRARSLVVCIATPSFGTATGAFRLGQFLGLRKPDLLVTHGTQLLMPEIAMDNVVFLGRQQGSGRCRRCRWINRSCSSRPASQFEPQARGTRFSLRSGPRDLMSLGQIDGRYAGQNCPLETSKQAGAA
jgi:hypothetical protein